MPDAGSLVEAPPRGADTPLERGVLTLLNERVIAESVRPGSSDCLVHPTGRIRWLGGTFAAKAVVLQHERGRLADRVMIGTTCRTDGCVLVEHLVARNLVEHGRWLGNDGWRGLRGVPPPA